MILIYLDNIFRKFLEHKISIRIFRIQDYASLQTVMDAKLVKKINKSLYTCEYF